jgi:hypothetical protein
MEGLKFNRFDQGRRPVAIFSQGRRFSFAILKLAGFGCAIMGPGSAATL